MTKNRQFANKTKRFTVLHNSPASFGSIRRGLAYRALLTRKEINSLVTGKPAMQQSQWKFLCFRSLSGFFFLVTSQSYAISWYNCLGRTIRLCLSGSLCPAWIIKVMLTCALMFYLPLIHPGFILPFGLMQSVFKPGVRVSQGQTELGVQS